ncbi:glutaredoxin family protein [Verminephrobacter aporrectodeae subsp. tuberculatae]|uniref:Glutaredoxin family protein n=1 Tax=Verminephrobacter aporrectodeae subsp. tuberculatae TaxID=1110392 RepID=A0ABT3KQL7_9BURK|nr:glutaredoxin family protein [Verminephrobacter aporrectodeae subsp. tuberculatae]MCW8165947.1 glutaredoxin family protein [Verminephrobacter aporrectodeae subsp. tuberculatae]MCW8169993.1 glutaredoxin family protein [Verminephrobacter aporrectodeae subsp. tuberculatae]MCW8207221.1 glutaredoxin family protein [Verminephrobacter aporrectodeae subsp. tuberculatae]
MPTICPKCRAVRLENTPGPEWQCPACGVAYAKAYEEAPAAPPPRKRPRAAPVVRNAGFPWGKFFTALFVAWALYVGYQAGSKRGGLNVPSIFSSGLTQEQLVALAASGQASDVILYSTDWCPYCKAAKGWMNQYGFKYQECDIEKNASCLQQFQSLGDVGGVPYLIVKGQHMKDGFDSDAFVAALSQGGRR